MQARDPVHGNKGSTKHIFRTKSVGWVREHVPHMDGMGHGQGPKRRVLTFGPSRPGMSHHGAGKRKDSADGALSLAILLMVCMSSTEAHLLPIRGKSFLKCDRLKGSVVVSKVVLEDNTLMLGLGFNGNLRANSFSTAEGCLKAYEDFAGCMINSNHPADQIVLRRETSSDRCPTSTGNGRLEEVNRNPLSRREIFRNKSTSQMGGTSTRRSFARTSFCLHEFTGVTLWNRAISGRFRRRTEDSMTHEPLDLSEGDMTQSIV